MQSQSLIGNKGRIIIYTFIYKGESSQSLIGNKGLMKFVKKIKEKRLNPL